MRSAEEKDADDRLTDAILDSLRQSGHDDLGVVVEHISIVATAEFDEDGDSHTGVYYTTGSEGSPKYRLLGLLEFVATALRAEIVKDNDD